MDNADLYGRFLTLNYALPEKIKGGLQGCAAQPIWADADSWFEHQQQEEEMQLLKVENQAAMQGGARARREGRRIREATIPWQWQKQKQRL
ncbi:hypothetical protein HHK36_007380 [Tetracentron sinense]|uniref:Uncharacterized protein n=1 Tax=Tetracentron sinense TaxID=13715 RepID=A0A834ZMI3_TETSI|nr:hypothetical protein HHK36_007380 [Tetracentron sinense]